MLFRKPKYRCKAAEASLLFQPSGEIFSCHYNRGYILGRYPENSIQEIWNGKRRKELLKSIFNGNFDKGCFSCKTAIEQGLTHGAGFNKYDYITLDKSGFPVSIEFQLDNICNLECIMCSGEYSNQIRKNREKGEAYISPYDDRFVNQLDNFIPNLKYAAFTGGEPFLFDIYYKIWDKIKILNPNLNLYISSNGTVLNDRVKSYLNELNFNLTISIDSLKKENYERIRKNAILEETLNNLEYFNNYLKEKQKQLNVKCLVTPQNYKDLPDLINYCNDNLINLLPKIVILPAFASIENLETEELKNIIDLLNKNTQKQGGNIIAQNNSRFQEIIGQIKEIIDRKRAITESSFEDLSNDILSDILTENLLSQLKNESDEQKESYLQKINTVINSIDIKQEQKKALVGFLNVPPELLIGEFHRSDIEKLVERFKQSGKNL